MAGGILRAVFFCSTDIPPLVPGGPPATPSGTDGTRIRPGLVQAIITSADPTDTTALADLLIPR